MLGKYLKQSEGNKEVELWINTVLKSYLSKSPEDQGEIEHILDFLKSSAAPKRFKKMGYKVAKEQTAKWVARLTKKGNNIDDTDAIETKLKFRDGFRLVKLVGKKAFEREGNLMSHCVASYADKTGTSVYSLRDASNNPHCTIEVQGDKEVNQIKGKGNGSIHPKYIKKVIKVLDYFKVPIKKEEMSNLGYYFFEKEEFKFLKKRVKDLNTVKVNKVEYYFKGC